MIRSNFQPAFNIAVSHSYFEQNICSCLRFKPGAATQTLLKRFELKKRDRVNGFDFFTNSRTPLPAFLAYIGNATGYNFFDFEIQAITPAFNLFTEIPIDWLGQLAYDSSYGLNTQSGGIVQLCANPTSENVATGIGSMKIYFDDIIKENNQGGAQFAINYTARATQWQYFVINKSAVPLGNPKIAGKANISFGGPENVTIDNGQQAMLFTSDNLIPLSDVPVHQFNLVNNSDSSANQKVSAGKIIFKGLPNPDPVRIGIDMTGKDTRVVSPMYVYV